MRGAHRADRTLSSPRVVIYSTILVASLVPPVYLFVRSFVHGDSGDAVVAVVCGVLYLLVLSRLWDVASFQRRAMVRERTLRLAGAALASATTAEEIAVAVQHAATAVVSRPERAPRGQVTALLAVRRDGRLRAVLPVRATASAAVADELSGDPLRELTEELLPELDRPRFIPADEFGVVRPGAVRVGPAEGALLCPLMLKDRPTGDPHIGVLCVYGLQPVLAELSPVLEILAGQAALAVERVTLTQEVIRQRGQALFRTLVRNTSDAILIIGDEGVVAYATPSAAAIFGHV